MAKKHLCAIAFIAGSIGSFLAASSWAATPIPSLVATAPQPAWSELEVQQKIILAPLADDWDSLEFYRQKKWLGIAARFPSMSPLEQRRVQGQMQTWGKMTPYERELARRNFLTTSQLPDEKKQALRQKWLEYSQLSADEKEKLMQKAPEKPMTRRLPLRSSPAPAPAGFVAGTRAQLAVWPPASSSSPLSSRFASRLSAIIHANKVPAE